MDPIRIQNTVQILIHKVAEYGSNLDSEPINNAAVNNSVSSFYLHINPDLGEDAARRLLHIGHHVVHIVQLTPQVLA